MTTKQELKKKETIIACNQIINMDKFDVLSRETIDMESDIDWGLDIPEKATNILVIYFQK